MEKLESEGKIGIVDHVGAKAGMNHYTNGLAEGFAKNSVKVTICSNYDHDTELVQTHNIFPTFVRNSALQFLFLMKAFTRSALILRRSSIKYVIIHLFKTDIFFFFFTGILKLTGLKVITISHDVESLAGDENDYLKRLFYNRLSHQVVVHNAYSLDKIKKYIKDKNKLLAIQQGGYLNLPDRSMSLMQARDHFNLESDEKLVVFFGQIKKVKRLDIFLKSVKQTPENVKFLVAGRAWKDDYSRYEKIIEEENIGTRVLQKIGYVPDNERDIIFKAANMMVLPYDEIYQSAVLLMAMSYGIPIITSDADAFLEVLVDKSNALIFPKGDFKSLADKINLIANDVNLAERLSLGSLKTIEDQFSWSKIARQYLINIK